MASLIFIGSPVLSAGDREVPKKLFDIPLGAVYDIGSEENSELGNLPIQKFAGLKRFLGNGIHFYFQPNKTHKFFEYIEKRDYPKAQYFETSFRLYMLPVIPDSVSSLEELESTRLNWEVILISWSGDAEDKDDAYFWAMDLCKTFSLDIAVEPEITNFYDSKWYECQFSEDGRVFKVTSFSSKRVELRYAKEIAEAKDKAVENKVRLLQVDEIRPY